MEGKVEEKKPRGKNIRFAADVEDALEEFRRGLQRRYFATERLVTHVTYSDAARFLLESEEARAIRATAPPKKPKL